MNEQLEPLVKELAAAHRRSLRGDRLAAELERGLDARAATAPARRALPRLVFVGALGSVAVGLLIASQVSGPERTIATTPRAHEAPAVAPLAFSVGEPARPGRAGDELDAAEARFSDGSRVQVQAGGRARVDALNADGAALTLHEGLLDARIVHAARTRWQVRAGDYAIRVVGTRFAATWAPGARKLNVRLFEGAVEVSGPDLPVTRVAAGQRLEVASTGARLVADELDAPQAGDAPLAPPRAPPGLAPQPGHAAPEPRAGERWRDLAAGGRYREALTSLGEGFTARCTSLGSEDVIWLGDVARLAGDPQRAAQAYGSALRRFPAQDRPVFALGLLAFDVRHDYSDAARWFARYLEAHGRGPLAPEAAGRLMESLQRAGDADGARAAAASYLQRYPSGAQAALARRVLDR